MNSRLDTVQAVYLRAKLARLEKWNELRRTAAARYAELLGRRPRGPAAGGGAGQRRTSGTSTWCGSTDRDEVLERLETAGVGVGIHYPTPVHLTGAYRDLGPGPGSFPVAEDAAGRILSLPMFPHLEEAQQQYVASVLSEAVGTRR